MESRTDLTEVLNYIDPAGCTYAEWLNVGMALKEEGYDCSVWEDWSRRESRYRKGECQKKWNTFLGNGNPVTGGTIIEMAKQNGWVPSYGHELDWGDSIGGDDQRVLDPAWVEDQEFQEPTDEEWSPVNDLIKYLETLFSSEEQVGYVTSVWERDGGYFPTKGNWDRTAGELIDALNKCKGDIGAVMGDIEPQAGAWIRFNPLDGTGVRNDNVTDFRYALVESDSMDLAKQNALIRELELPVACLVYSGGKSVHAIVRVDAPDYKTYRERVDFLYTICKKNGLQIDQQNKNPSRLSRMPGVVRNGHKQFLIDTNIGKSSWTEWKEYIEGVNDDLPDPETLKSVWDNLPELSPPLIDGILRQGQKMLLSGPSKAGKTLLLMELAIAIAEGTKWLNWQCTQGKVLYVNLEVAEASCFHRFKEVYTHLDVQPRNLQNIEIWNLRGRAVPMDKLVPKLIRRAAKKDFIAIIIDPIYKVITGDENSAEQMSNFCNQFDKICTELNTAVIYCHHHSKGYQGSKRSMDRSSGSGVFARDPDALLDMTELQVTDAVKGKRSGPARAKAVAEWLDDHKRWWRSVLPDGVDLNSDESIIEFARTAIFKQNPLDIGNLYDVSNETKEKVDGYTAWRIEGILREFQGFKPVNCWFQYPIHVLDSDGLLSDAKIDGDADPRSSWKDRNKKEALTVEQKFENQFSFLAVSGDDVPLDELCDNLGRQPRTIEKWLGTGKQCRKALAKRYEIFADEDGEKYVREKNKK